MFVHSNAEVVRKAFTAFARRDLDELARLYDRDMTWHVNGASEFAGVHRGREAGLQMLRRVIEASGGTWSIQLHDVVANDEHAVALGSVSAATRGKQLETRASFVYHVREGVLTEAWYQFEDQAAFDGFFADVPELEDVAHMSAAR